MHNPRSLDFYGLKSSLDSDYKDQLQLDQLEKCIWRDFLMLSRSIDL